jgi:isopentenyl diphosphate isomerase/L-lactate dehydrogenase-like FMN-dependent dehydrogenase
MHRFIVDPFAHATRGESPIASMLNTNSTSRIFDAGDAHRLARKRLPRLVYDFIEGAAGLEVSAMRNTRRFDDIMLQSRVMADVAERSIKTELLGRSYDRPFGVAPMGMCNLACPSADAYLGALAKQRNLPVCLSSAASSTIEDMRHWDEGNAWFQLYFGQSLDHSLALVDRARSAGYDTLVLTVDVPQVSRRTRDLRNGFTMPFAIGPKQFLDFALHPRWSFATLRNGAPSPKNFETPSGTSFNRHASRAGADWAFLDRLRGLWKGKLIVKGVTSPTDAMRIRSAGADAVYVSNHGGRQLDSAPAAIDLLPPIRAAVGPEYPLIFDSGLRSGEDVIKALALGADFVMFGRPLLHALAAEGLIGLNALIDAIEGDISVAMAQIGVKTISQIDKNCLWQGGAIPLTNTEPDITLTTKRA